MECVCPVCNGLTTAEVKCPKCGEMMEDTGMVEDYYGPYSPYDNQELYEPPVFWNLADRLPCVHLYSCPDCGYDERVGVKQVVM